MWFAIYVVLVLIELKKRSFTGSGLQWNNQEKAVLVKVFWSDLEEFVSRQTIPTPYVL